MLDNPFLVPSFCKLNHISLCFIQISTTSAYSLQGKQCFFVRCFGPLGKFQHKIKISIKTVFAACLFLMTVIKCKGQDTFLEKSIIFYRHFTCVFFVVFFLKMWQNPSKYRTFRVFSRSFLSDCIPVH